MFKGVVTVCLKFCHIVYKKHVQQVLFRKRIVFSKYLASKIRAQVLLSYFFTLNSKPERKW